MERFIVEIRATGEFSEQELMDFIVFQLRGGSLDNDNAFIREDCEAEIIDCDVDVY